MTTYGHKNMHVEYIQDSLLGISVIANFEQAFLDEKVVSYS